MGTEFLFDAKKFHFGNISLTVCLSMNTGKSLSEALILASIDPLYDNRLFIELQEKIQTHHMLCTQIVLNVKTKKQFVYTTCAKLVFFL